MTTDLRDLIDKELARFDVPAAAVTVVADGAVLLAETVGTRDVVAGLAAGPGTRFPLASDTKAFTAALLCLQAEEGRLDLDAPVQAVLPWFRLKDPLASAVVTVRDMLAHRSGVPRHDWVGAGELPLTLEDLARAMAHLEPAAGLRQAPLYSNLGYCVAGLVTEVLEGRPWSDVLHDRLLAPLGMSGASAEPGPAQQGDFAHGYSRLTGGLTRQRPMSPWHLGPPGGLLCTAGDLAPWLLARLGRRPDVVGEAVLVQLHGPAIPMPAGPDPERLPLGYALGAVIESYDGQPLVHHGGSLPGWSSDVLLLPRAGIGVAVLCNLDQTPFPEALALTLADALLDRPDAGWGSRRLEQHEAARAAWIAGRDIGTALPRAPRIPSAELAGTWAHPAYGELVLRCEADGLAIDFHGMHDELVVAHVDRDRWEVRALGGLVAVPLVPRLGTDGGVAGIAVAFEPLVEPVLFTPPRRADK
jgi:CubicO group peptidase (beta-lactamase class C family)